MGEVRLRVRLRVRWSLRAISAQILVHHPTKLFFLSMGGWGGSTSGSASGSLGIASNLRTKAGRGGGGSTSGSASGSVVIASNICTNPGASSHQTVFLSRGGWGGSTSGSASGSLGIASNFRRKAGASSQQPFFLGGGVGEVRLRVRLRVWWAFRAMSVQSPVHHPGKPVFFEGGWGRFDFGFGRGSL